MGVDIQCSHGRNYANGNEENQGGCRLEECTGINLDEEQTTSVYL
jgi:hypothetical protein